MNEATVEIAAEETCVLPAAFQYDDDRQSIVVEQRYSEAQSLMRQGLQNMIEAGGKFAEIRDMLRHNKHGGFDAWIEAKQLGRRTVYRILDLHSAFATVPQMAQLDIAATAAYLLASPSVPDEARAAAIERAQAGERVGVSTAKAIIAEHMAGVDELRPPVLAWARGVHAADPRGVLQQIALNNAVGLSHFQRLDEHLRGLGLRFMRADLKKAVERVIADLPAPAARVTVIEPAADDKPAEIWQLEQALDKWLGVLCATPGERRLILEDINNRRDPWYNRVFAANTLPPNRTNGNVLQAAHNLLDHLNQADSRLRQLTPSGNGRTVYVEERQDNGSSSVGGPTTGRCTHCTHCGRPLTDPAHVAAGCGPVCAAKADNNGANGHGNAGLKATPLPIGTADAAPEGADLVAIVDAWLKEMVEYAELPEDKISFRHALNQIVNARTMRVPPEVWRNFIRFEQWPADTTNDQKVDAARAVLARLSGKPIDPVPAARPAPATYQPIVPQFDRDHSRIRQLEAALTALIEFVESQAALSEPDPDTVAAIEAAVAVLRDPTYK